DFAHGRRKSSVGRSVSGFAECIRSRSAWRSSLAFAVLLFAVAPAAWPGSIEAVGSAAGKVEPYDPAAIPSLFLHRSGRESWPAWRRSVPAGHWTRIEGTDLGDVIPKRRVQGALKARIDAWNGLAADRGRSRLYSAANGGHADYAGNEVYELDLETDRPRWKLLRGPSRKEDVLASDYNRKAYHDYYRDGRPASTHTYYALQFLASRNAIFKFGAGS